MKRVIGILCDSWKLPLFVEALTENKFSFEVVGEHTRKVTNIRITVPEEEVALVAALCQKISRDLLQRKNTRN